MQTRRFTLSELATVLLVLFIVLAILGTFRPVVNVAREPAKRVNCAGNLKQIGMALLGYSGDNVGWFPVDHTNGGTDFGRLVQLGYAQEGNLWCCPSRRNHRIPASSSDYRYIGSGLKDDNASATTNSLAYDMSGNHPHNAWMNVLLLDGHTEGAKPGTVSAKGVVFNND